jgi:hypothetical protein
MIIAAMSSPKWKVCGAVMEAHGLRINRADHVDSRIELLDEILGMRLHVQLDAFLHRVRFNECSRI